MYVDCITLVKINKSEFESSYFAVNRYYPICGENVETHTNSLFHLNQGPYTSGHLKSKAIQDFSRPFQKEIQDFLTTCVLLSAAN